MTQGRLLPAPSSQPTVSTPVFSDAGKTHNGLWVEVLVDCPGVQGVFTYGLPVGLRVHPGDILSVPFGAQQLGGVVVRNVDELPAGVNLAQLREIDGVIARGFFPPAYWEILLRVAEYYCTPLMQVIRMALPTGLLGRSQRRIRLSQEQELEPPLEVLSALSPVAHQLLTLLQSSKTGDYSWQYLQRQQSQAYGGLQELLKLGWVESYLQPPTSIRPKQRQAVTLVDQADGLLSPRQQEVLRVLQRQGGELWLTDLLALCQTSSTTLKAIAQKGYLVIQPREVLRSETSGSATPDTPKTLTTDQATALATIQSLTGYISVLLHGVTGSGKTEVYLQAIAPLLHQGKSAIVLVPEIGLTPQLTDRFRARFGDRVCVYHSALSDGERYDTWRQLLTGTAQVVIGTRSAIFAPLSNLGLIILDEEHDSSFKQDQPSPCYHARTVAHWRAQLEHCPLILGSATPSLETWLAVKDTDESLNSQHDTTGQESNRAASRLPSIYLSLPTRVQARPMPAIEVVDMRQELGRGNRSIFSQALQAALHQLHESREQGILFIQRRGHSTFVSCRSCGYVVMCPHCDVSLAYHQIHAEARPVLRCHYCNYTQAHPEVCPQCQSPYFKHFGSGTQRVTQSLEQEFPKLRVLRFDSDTTRTKGAHRSLLTRFAQGEADLLVGTQMLTKGIDLPQVTLVGIVAADGLLHLSDYRASERTFQVLTQVAGRCGRGDRPGRVILQTYSPDHSVINAVQQQQYESFVQTELEQREMLNYPPYGRLILLKFSGLSPGIVQTTAAQIAAALKPLQEQGVERLGPTAATIERVARRYRWQILLKIPATVTISASFLSDLRDLCPSSVSFTIDIDPLHIG
ncbi:primosomal protein N' [Phormidium sp. CLA17]|uniref:primosomal protein N' n=1 Tax=Leptolyngbya sp. Cla-17 TaxID=2803751 RepID=UPI001491A566|nr:primosomal protein N' [Leptolyngbya sp. Cla-17]MBM0740472.1 primosomal protein N' [Leptolyngbya sp. Cla-17]